MCTRCRGDKKVPKVWSGENNMDPIALPGILSNMSDAEQMPIARLAPTVHVHLLKHGGIASKGHCIAFPQAVQEPATILPRLPAEVDIIRVRRQGKDDTHKDFRVRRHRVEDTVLKEPFVLQTTLKNQYLKRMRKIMLLKQKNSQTGWMYMQGRAKDMRV